MEQTANEFLKAFRERFKHPILTVYAIMLIIYNWDIIGIYFSSRQPIEYRIAYLSSLYKDPYYERLWIPFIKAVFVMLLAPTTTWLLRFPLNFFEKQTREKNKKNRIDDKKHEEELAEIEYRISVKKSGSKEADEIRIAHEKEVLGLQEVNNSLNETISSKDETISNLNNIIINDESNITRLNEDLNSLKSQSSNYFDIISDHNFIIQKLNQVFSNVTNALNSNKVIAQNLHIFAGFPQGKNITLDSIKNEFHKKYDVTEDEVNGIVNTFISNKFWTSDGLNIIRVTLMGEIFMKTISVHK